MTKQFDVLTQADKCHDDFVKCIKAARGNPIKQQICIAKYLACISQLAVKSAASITAGPSPKR